MKWLSIIALAFATACSDSDGVWKRSPLYCREMIPTAYTVLDTLKFVADDSRTKQFKIVSIEDAFFDYYGNYQRIENYTIRFNRIGDSRIFYPSGEPRIYFQNYDVTVIWESCASSFHICENKEYVNHMLINGKDYSKCVTMRNFCHDTANPIRVIYDIKEGIVSYTDSSGTRWDLVPK